MINFEGIYYSPEGRIIYEGEIMNDFYYDSEFLEIYNNDGNLLYNGKNYNYGKKKDNYQFLKDVILSRDKILNNNYIDMKLNNTHCSITFISINHSGRTAIIERLIEDYFYPELNNSYTPKLDFYHYVYNNVEYDLEIYNLSGNHHQFKNIHKFYIKNDNISIYVIDSPDSNGVRKIDEEIITFINENKEKNEKFIYLILGKIDIYKENISGVESIRKHAKKLILDGSVYRYFELSAKTREGFDEFENCLKFDLDLCLKLEEKKIKPLEVNIDSDISDDDSLSFSKKLDKFLNF